jgi:hypothetical protein
MAMTRPQVQRERNLPVSIPPGEVPRLLGYGEADVPERVQRLLAEVEREAQRLLQPACAWLRSEGGVWTQSPYLRELEEVALCLVTVGPCLEEAVDVQHRAGDLGRSLILNAYGSAAAEAAADAANRLIREAVEGEGLRCSRRFSPGYGGWDVSEQRWIVKVLDGERLGVALTEGCMMEPRKSITFAVNIGEDPKEMREDNPCDSCDLEDCSHRRTTTVAERKGRAWTTFTGPESSFCPRDRWS